MREREIGVKIGPTRRVTETDRLLTLGRAHQRKPRRRALHANSTCIIITLYNTHTHTSLSIARSRSSTIFHSAVTGFLSATRAKQIGCVGTNSGHFYNSQMCLHDFEEKKHNRFNQAIQLSEIFRAVIRIFRELRLKTISKPK